MMLLAAGVLAVLTGCRTPEPPVQRAVPPPQKRLPAPRATSYAVYTVRQGETLDSVCRKLGLTPARVLEENHHLDSASDISPGQVIFVPQDIAQGAAVRPQQNPEGEPRVPGTGPVRSVTPQALHKGKPAATFWWPTDGRVSRRFCEQYRGFVEPGIGIRAQAGTEVCAASGGQVIACVRGPSSPEGGWGNVVVVRHWSSFVSWYALLGGITVREGQQVSKGDRIGAVAQGSELAFRLFLEERCVDPLSYLP